MKHFGFISTVVTILLFGFCLSLFSLGLYKDDIHTDYDAVMPKSLKYVEAEAFSGTALRSAYFSDGLLSVGEYSFSNTPYLAKAFFPATTAFVADNAFVRSAIRVISSIRNTYIFLWSQTHNVSYGAQLLVVTLRAMFIEAEYILFLLLTVLVCKRQLQPQVVRSMRPQDRPEMYPINYCFP